LLFFLDLFFYIKFDGWTDISLSSRALKLFVDDAVTTCSGRLFQYGTTLFEKKW
jgi:hypothetical protein